MSNWLESMSVAQRKKQGITTVTPTKAKKKVAGKIKLSRWADSHLNKLEILKRAMRNWQYTEGYLDSKQGRLFEADINKVDELLGETWADELLGERWVPGEEKFLTKKEMLDMNELFKMYARDKWKQDRRFIDEVVNR